MTDYDPFATTFSQSRKSLVWQEVDETLVTLRSVYPPEYHLRVLDVGCGNGRLISHLERHGYDGAYLGLDLSAGMLREAVTLYP